MDSSQHRHPDPGGLRPNPRVARWVAAGLAGSTLLVAGCGGSSSTTSTGPPVHLNPFRGPGFTVGLPAKPQHLTLTVQGDGAGRPIKFRLYFVKAGQVGFEVGEVRAKLAAGRLTRGALGSSGGTMRDSTKTTYAGFPATDERVGDPGGKKATIFLREINASTRTFLLGYVLPGDLMQPPPGYTAFVSSLRIH